MKNAVAVTILEKKKPSGKFQGYRLVASVINSAQYYYDFASGTGAYGQSHAEKYNVRATLDYPEKPSEEQVDRFLEKLKSWNKVTHITWQKHGTRTLEKI